MRPGPRTVLLAAALFAAGCDDSPPQPAPSPDPGAPPAIRGDERLGWDQPAANRAELATFSYAIYVDGARREMAGVTCEDSAAAAGFPCSGQLPLMTPGLHTLELAAFFTDDDRVVEGPKSTPFQVNVVPALGAPVAGGTAPGAPEGDPSRRPPLQPLSAGPFARVADGYTDIAAAALTPDGWLIVAERAGRLRANHLRDARQPSALAVAGTRAQGEGGSLVSVAVDPAFERTGHVYVLQTALSREGTTWQLARYRQAGTAFGERAVVMETGLAPDEPAGAVRFGPDGRLYVALQDAGRRERSGNAQRETLILRLNPDGTTPQDQPAGSPVIAALRGLAHAFDWHPDTGALLLAAGSAEGPVRLLTAGASLRRFRAREPAVDRVLPGTRGVSAIAFVGGATSVWRQGALLVAGESGLHLVDLDPRDLSRPLSLETLTDTPLRAVVPGPDGALYLATADSILRLRPNP